MIPGFDDLTYYEVLDISHTVEVKEIQEAYYRVRSAFGKNALASYSLFTDEEREEILKLAERAYHTLIDDQAREEYLKTLSAERARPRSIDVMQTALPFESVTEVTDTSSFDDKAGAEDSPAEEQKGGRISLGEDIAGPEKEEAVKWESEEADVDVWSGAAEKVVEEEEKEEILITEAPRPEIPGKEESPAVETETEGRSAASSDSVPPDESSLSGEEGTEEYEDIEDEGEDTEDLDELTARQRGATEGEFEDTIMDVPSHGKRACPLDYLESGVSGKFLQEARESLGLSMEDIWEVTRIRKPIIVAIEAEDHTRLPADVFLRGMLRIYARVLELEDPEAVVQGYMERLLVAREWMD